MSKTKTEKQMVSNYLTQKQIDSIVPIHQYEKLGKVVLVYQEKSIYGGEVFESTTGYDDFYFLIKIDKKGALTITVGIHGLVPVDFSSTTYNLGFTKEVGMIGFKDNREQWCLDNDIVKLIKSHINSMSKYLCNSTNVK
jgi:hypothetical protein